MKIKQGISLIVLVITIIVMVILAGAIILTLNNSGIIDRASDAVEQTNLATVKELTQMAWASAYAAGDTELDELQDAVDKALRDNKVNTTKYVVEVTTEGVNVVLKGPWVQTGQTVTDGEITINVGEKINYIATGTDYTGDWKVLGASKYGELLIMSDSDVTTHTLGYKSTTDTTERLKESQNAWLNGASELDAICELYGKGKGATGARSVTVEDIDRVIGYNKETFGKGQTYAYGNEVVYSYNQTVAPSYAGKNGKTGILANHNNGFHFFNGVEFIHINDLTAGTSGMIFATLKSDYYGYLVSDFELTDETVLLLFGKYDADKDKYSNYYWLASPYIYTYSDYVSYGMHLAEGDRVGNYLLWNSNGREACYEYGVRAVVSLSSDINLTGSSETGWTY